MINMPLNLLPSIPAIMRAQVPPWTRGALLLEKWFRGPANANAAAGQHDTSTITMRWALAELQRRGQLQIYHAFFADKIWVNDAAKREIAALLGRLRKLSTVPTTFGNLSFPAATINANHIQSRSLGSVRDPLDELFAALGRFEFKFAVSGSVSPYRLHSTPPPGGVGPRFLHSHHFVVQIKEVGVYIEDSFDFNGYQELGFWDPQTNRASKLPFWGSYRVTNELFRNWRTANGRGGDYMIYSDVVVHRRNPPDTFIF